MASVPEPAKAVEPAAGTVADAATTAADVAPAAVAAVIEAAPVAAAVAAETVANALPKAKPAAKRSARAIKTKRTPTKTVKTVAAKAAPKPKGKTMNDTVKTMTANMTAQSEKIAADMKTRAEDAVAKGKQLFADWNDFSKGNVEALVESGKIAAKGFEQLGREQADFARKSFEQTTAAFRGMASVKSPTELTKLYSDYARTSFDALVAQTSHSTEAMLKLAGEIAQPISNRFAVAAEKVKLAA